MLLNRALLPVTIPWKGRDEGDRILSVKTPVLLKTNLQSRPIFAVYARGL